MSDWLTGAGAILAILAVYALWNIDGKLGLILRELVIHRERQEREKRA